MYTAIFPSRHLISITFGAERKASGVMEKCRSTGARTRVCCVSGVSRRPRWQGAPPLAVVNCCVYVLCVACRHKLLIQELFILLVKGAASCLFYKYAFVFQHSYFLSSKSNTRFLRQYCSTGEHAIPKSIAYVLCYVFLLWCRNIYILCLLFLQLSVDNWLCLPSSTCKQKRPILKVRILHREV